MSTIEKAMGKLGADPQEAATERPADAVPEDTSIKAENSSQPARIDETVSSVAKAAPDLADDEITSRAVNLNWSHLTDEGIIDPRSGKHSHISDQMRNIKRPLLMHADGQGASIVKHPNLIMVTSSLPGEGKTFTAINLAMSMAMEMDKKVLLVDADVPKPEVSKRLGVETERGLTDLLSDKNVAVSDVLVKTDAPNLMLMPAGRKHGMATELLASAAMRDLADELATRYADRVVIFDSPPLLMTTEARVLAELMGQIVVVVEECRTPQPVVQEALGLLQSCEIVGLVLNKGKRTSGTDYYGGYGYGYGYGYGQQQ